MNLKRISIAFILCFVAACSGHKEINSPVSAALSPTVAPVVAAKPAPVSRSDLPKGWREVKGNDWSFGVPKGWKSHSKVDDGLEAVYDAPDESLMVALGTEDNVKDLNTYAQSFVAGMVASGAKFLQGQEGDLNGNHVILLIFKAGDLIATNLVIVNGTKAYNFGCGGSIATFKENASMCGEVAKTLRITKK